jgi:hypothetical protein
MKVRRWNQSRFPKGFLPAYGSGLAFKGKTADGNLEFFAITDRYKWRWPESTGVTSPAQPGLVDAKILSITFVCPVSRYYQRR